MKGRFDHSKLGNVIIDSENIMKGTIVIMNVGSAALQDLAVCCFHQVTIVVGWSTVTSPSFLADAVENCVRWTVTYISSGYVSVYNIDNGMLRFFCLQIMDDDLAVVPEFCCDILRNLL